jgi:hypothetical protein
MQEKVVRRKKHPKSPWHHHPQQREVKAFSENLLQRGHWSAKAVCRRCGIIINDWEPQTKYGEFFHPVDPENPCVNSGTYSKHGYNSEFLPFMRKRHRRAIHRGARAASKFRFKR